MHARHAIAALLFGAFTPGLASCVAAEAPSGCSLAPGRFVKEVEIHGQARRAIVQVGPRATGASPLVFAWHGWGGRPEGMSNALDPAEFWPEAIVVAPEGAPRGFPGLSPRPRRGWQIREGEFADRDLALFDTLLTELSTTGCVDSSRVYSTGFSNGGFFSNLLGCTRADVLAAVAPVAGAWGMTACRGSLPVMLTHGTRDQVISYARGEQSFAHWGEHNTCRSMPAATPRGCVAGEQCRAETLFCSTAGGHTWPAKTSPAVVAFLKRHTSAPRSNPPDPVHDPVR